MRRKYQVSALQYLVRHGNEVIDLCWNDWQHRSGNFNVSLRNGHFISYRALDNTTSTKAHVNRIRNSSSASKVYRANRKEGGAKSATLPTSDPTDIHPHVPSRTRKTSQNSTYTLHLNRLEGTMKCKDSRRTWEWEILDLATRKHFQNTMRRLKEALLAAAASHQSTKESSIPGKPIKNTNQETIKNIKWAGWLC